MLDYQNMHGAKLRAICIESGLDVSNAKGKESYLKLLGNNMNTPVIITEASSEDMKAVGICTTAIRLDKLEADLKEVEYKGKTQTRSFKDGKHYFRIDPDDMTIHFLGGCLGPICQTLKCEDRFVLRMAQRYLMANTIAGKDFMVEHTN